MYKISINQSDLESSVEVKDGDFYVNDKKLDWDLRKIDSSSFHILHQNKTYTAHLVEINKEEKEFIFKINGKVATLSMKDKMDLLLEEMGMDDLAAATLNDLKAPMPGLINDIMVEDGQEVKKGDPLLILEAMKMENVIKCPGDGTVSSVKVSKGDSVEKNQLLIQF